MENEKSGSTDRRTFLKASAVGTAGVLAGGVGSNLFAKTSAWTAGAAVNSKIPNTRVVCCYDTRMVDSTKLKSNFTEQNAAIVTNAMVNGVSTNYVANNLDLMAKYLINDLNASAAQAWDTIFQLPAGRASWAEVRVAVKVNCIHPNLMHHVAIIAKVVSELTRKGVLPANITMYDACHGSGGRDLYLSYVGAGKPLPAGVKFSSLARSQTISVPVGTGNQNLTNVLALNVNGTTTYVSDLLINCAVNKGHGAEHGGFTLTMKNHAGTFNMGSHPASVKDMCDRLKSEALWGRQQLCIVDSLWGATGGPTSDANSGVPWQPLCRLVMGTFGPTVDYLTAKKIRGDIMGANPAAVYSGFLTEFGLAATDPAWVVVPASAVTGIADITSRNTSKNITFTVSGNGLAPTSKQIGLPDAGEHFQVGIFDLGGRTVRQLSVGTDLNVIWDGRSGSGDLLPAGNYVVKVFGMNGVTAETVSIMR